MTTSADSERQASAERFVMRFPIPNSKAPESWDRFGSWASLRVSPAGVEQCGRVTYRGPADHLRHGYGSPTYFQRRRKPDTTSVGSAEDRDYEGWRLVSSPVSLDDVVVQRHRREIATLRDRLAMINLRILGAQPDEQFEREHEDRKIVELSEAGEDIGNEVDRRHEVHRRQTRDHLQHSGNARFA